MEALIALLSLAFLAWQAVRIGKSFKHPEPTRLSASPARAAAYSPAGPELPAAKPIPTARDCWIPPGKATAVAGFQLSGGMLYVGSGLPSVAGYSTEPALIDPALPVNSDTPDLAGTGMTYWPSYDSLSPECRAGYLRWLSTDRRQPDAYIGYVFLYLYGLERRVLADRAGSGFESSELPAMENELKALLEAYGHNGSFNRYATQLRDILVALSGTEVAPSLTTETDSGAMPVPVRVGLGRLVGAGKRIPPDWAARWYITHPDSSLRTPARRCEKEFIALFRARYARDFGDGVLLPTRQKHLTLSIRPASASFAGSASLSLDVPDILQARGPINRLRAIGESCMDDLDAFSRWLGRNSNTPMTIAAVALLPREIASSHESVEAQAVWDWAAQHTQANVLSVGTSDELLQLCPSLGSGKLTKNEAVLLAQLLEKGGYGIEPDVRFGGPALAPEATVVLFRLADSAANPSPTPQYTATSALLHLAVAVAAADGTVSDAEQHHLRDRVAQALALTEQERLRLSAHLRWLVKETPSVTSLRSRIASLTSSQRDAIADFIVSIAGADGRIDPEEIKTLTKIFPLLGLAAEDVYSHVHGMAAGVPAPGPKGVTGGEPTVPAEIHGSPPASSASGPVRLNLDLVRAKLMESAQIGAILEEALVGADDAPELHGTPQTPPSPTARGAQKELLTRLVDHSKWPRLEFERLTAELRLLPDGAIDALNEAAFDKCGTPVIEGDDPLTIDLAIARELIQ